MDVNYYKQYEPIFGAWQIKRKLGEGNFGAVYEIEREDFGTTYHAALKTITIPKSRAELDSILDDGMDMTGAEQYLEQFVEKIVGEFVLMSKLKGNSNIVSYEDHQVIKHKKDIGWDILIRMELLTPMMTYMKTTSITRRDVIKLGIDMCRALELCQKYNIIHRDIKPENIFISDSGDFKLGDFGIAKEVEKTQSGLTKTGTPTYMAPEVYKGQAYGSSVDIYSLGVVLYRLLNHNRAPFMPQYPEPVSYSDRERALIMKMGGNEFPAPSGVEKGCRIAEIAMKACSYNPEDRYSSPTQMREDLEAILYTEGEGILMFPSGDNLDIKSVQYVSNSKNPNRTENLRDEQTEVMDDDLTEIMADVSKKFDENKKVKKSIWKIAVPAVAVAAVLAAGIGIYSAKNRTEPETVAVTDFQELTDPIEYKIQSPNVSDADYAILEKRLEAYGANYYIDKSTNTVAISKSELGGTTNEILATIHMLTGKGEVQISNADCNSDYTLTYQDLQKAEYVGGDEASFVLKTTENGKEKLRKLTEQIISSDNKELTMSVDGNVRLSINIDKVIENGRLSVADKDGKNTLASLLLDCISQKVYAEELSLSDKYMKLVVSFVNDGILTNNYEIYIDEKYGLVIEEPTPAETEEPVQEQMPEEQQELPQAENEKPAGEANQKSTQNNTAQQKSVQKKTTQQKPTQQQPVQQQPVQQQPVQQQPAQQQPAQQQPAQQPAQNSSNENNLPDFYVDFD